MTEMPNKGSHLAMLIVSFILGILWGLLALSPYNKMKAAIEAGDAETAWANAKKVKIFFWISIAVNVVFIIVRVAGGF